MVATPGIDRAVQRWIAGHHHGWTDGLALWLTHLGGTPLVLTVTIAVAALAWWRTRWWWLVAACLGGELAVEVSARLVKAAVGRPRPPFSQAVLLLANSSLPAAHVARATFAACLIAAALPAGRARRAAVAAGAVVVVVVGWTRVELGAHWFTDTLAALPFGLAAAAVPAWGLARLDRRPRGAGGARMGGRSSGPEPGFQRIDVESTEGGPMPTELEDLAARLRHLEDREAVRDTWLDYCNRLDAADLEALGDVFSEDATLEMDGLSPALDGTYRGRRSIIGDFYAKSGAVAARDGGGRLMTGHLSTNMQIRLDGDQATTLAYFFEIVDDNLVLIGTYQHRMRREPDRWRFAFLRIAVRYRARIQASELSGQTLRDILSRPV